MSYKEWQGKVVNQRLKNRKNYMQGPKSSPRQWQTYVRLFKRFLAGKKQPVILVLGSTPELRDLALSYPRATLITVDIKKAVVKKMAELMKHKNNPREKVILANWVAMPLAKNSVDLMVGDGAIANLLPNQFDSFFKQASKILKPDGAILLRDGVRIKKFILAPQQIVKKSRQQKWHWFDLYANLYFSSTGNWYNNETCQISMLKFFSWVKKAHDQRILNNCEFNQLWPWQGNLVHTIFPRQKLMNFFSKYFYPLAITQPNDLYSQKFVYFFAGKPKK